MGHHGASTTQRRPAIAPTTSHRHGPGGDDPARSRHEPERTAVPDAVVGAAAQVRISVLDATDWPPERWDALAVESAAGHYMQSHAWLESKRGLGWDVHRYVIVADGRDIGVVALQERSLLRRLPGRLGRLRYGYAPRGPVPLAGDLAGEPADGSAGLEPAVLDEAAPPLVHPSTAHLRALLAGLRRIARRDRIAILTIDPEWPDTPETDAALSAAGFFPAARQVQVSRTAMIATAHPDERDQHRLLRKSAANDVNRARRAGVVAERVDLRDPAGAEAALREFFAMFETTGRRRGFVVRDRDYQLGQWMALGQAGHAALWFATIDGRRIAGSLLMRAGNRWIQALAGYPDPADMARYRPNHLLQWSIIRWAAESGCAAYDLGGVDTSDATGIPAGPDHPLWDLYVFKRNMGGRPQIYVGAREYARLPVFRLAWNAARRIRR